MTDIRSANQINKEKQMNHNVMLPLGAADGEISILDAFDTDTIDRLADDHAAGHIFQIAISAAALVAIAVAAGAVLEGMGVDATDWLSSRVPF